MNKILLTGLLSAVLGVTTAQAQGTVLIGPSMRNGSFEDGVASQRRCFVVPQANLKLTTQH